MDLDPGEFISEVYYRQGGVLFLRTDNAIDPYSYRVRKAAFFVDEKRCHLKEMHVFDERKRCDLADVSIGERVLVLPYKKNFTSTSLEKVHFSGEEEWRVPEGVTQIAGMDEREESVFLEGTGKWKVEIKKREAVPVEEVKGTKGSLWKWSCTEKKNEITRVFLDKRNLLEVTDLGFKHMVLPNKREIFREEIEMACLGRKGICMVKKEDVLELWLGNICTSYEMKESGGRVVVNRRKEIEPVLPESENKRMNRRGEKVEKRGEEEDIKGVDRGRETENKGDSYSSGNVSIAIKDNSIEFSIRGKAAFSAPTQRQGPCACIEQREWARDVLGARFKERRGHLHSVSLHGETCSFLAHGDEDCTED